MSIPAGIPNDGSKVKQIQSPASASQPATNSATQGKLNIQRPGKWAVFKVTVLTKEGVKPFLYFLAYKIAQFFTLGRTSKLFVAKAYLAESELVWIWSKFYFGADAIGKSKNIARLPILTAAEDLEAAKKLKEECEKNSDLVQVQFKDQIKGLLTDGICWGIKIDNAQQLLIAGKSIEEVIKANEEGASEEAAANQIVLESMSSKLTFNTEKFLTFIIDQFETLKGCPESQGKPFYEVDFNTVKVKVDELLTKITAGSNRETIEAIYKTDKSRIEAFFQFQILDSNKMIEKLSQDKEANKDLINELQDRISNLKKKRIEDLNAVKWAFEISQKMLGIEVLPHLDPEIGTIANGVINTLIEKDLRENFVANARGIVIKPTFEQMGHYSQFPDDFSYLKNLKNLEAGLYGIDFNLADGGHTITYRKVSDEEGYMLDPNGMQIKCSNPEDTLIKLQKLLNIYPPSKKKEKSKQSTGKLAATRPKQHKEPPLRRIVITKLEAIPKQ